MMSIISRNVCEKLFHMQLSRTEQGNEVAVPQPQARKQRQVVESAGASTESTPAAKEGAADGAEAAERPVRRNEPKVGRNDPCPCGSGKKYKKCHGVVATV